MRTHKHGGNIYQEGAWTDFSANINPLGPPEGVRRAACESLSRIECYPDVECRRLRKALAQKEGVLGQQLIFGNGAAELIFALAMGLKPKKALLTIPGFAEYEQALSAMGCDCVYYNRRDGFLVGEDFLDQIGDGLDLVILCNPNNPTGDLLEKAFLKRVLDQCRRHGTVLAVDECFLGFLEKPEDYSLKEYVNAYPNLFLLNAFTKLYAMPGLRLGYGMCSDGKLLSAMESALQPWNVSVPAQAAGEAALREDAYVERTRRLIRGERTYLERELAALGLEVYPGTANFLFFEGPAHLEEDLKRLGFLIRDCSNYRGLKEGYYRVAVRTREENDRLLAALGTCLGQNA